MLSKVLLLPILLVSTLTAASPAPIEERSSYCPSKPAGPLTQRALFNAFVQKFFNKKDVADTYELYVADNVIEHDPFIADGREAGIEALTPLIAAASFDLVHVLYDGGIGAVHSKVTLPGGAPFMATADYFRYDGTCIVEHWDVSESLPANATSSHPLF